MNNHSTTEACAKCCGDIKVGVLTSTERRHKTGSPEKVPSKVALEG